MNERVDASLEPAAALPRTLPGPYPGEPPELAGYRRNPGDEKTFVRLRRSLRDAEDWRALASLLVIHAAHMEGGGGSEGATKAAELCIQAYELWMERVKDRTAAAHALARAVMLKPDNTRAIQRLRKLYEGMATRKELVALLRWQLRTTTDPVRAAELHVELAKLLQENLLSVGEAVQHYEQALELCPGHVEATTTLIEIYVSAGASERAGVVIDAELRRGEPRPSPTRAAELHRRMAKIEAGTRGNVPAAARHLQAALELLPDDIAALRAFGVLYLGSGKAADGVRKAADIFYKAAELARRQQRHDEAIKLLRRALSLAPDHQQAAAALESTLTDAQDWLALDDLYREWLLYDEGPDAVPLLLRRADLLETRLHRREEARQLFEEASRHEPPEGESWRRLEQIYEATGDVHALASLLESRAERMPDQIPSEALLKTAQIYRDELGNDERAAVFFYKVLEREPFNAAAFEGYKEHFRRKHSWSDLRDLILYQIQQASAHDDARGPLADPAFAEEFVELADICERRLGDIDGALDAWQRMTALYPRDPRPSKAIARIEKRARMWDNMVRVQEDELARTVDPRKRLDILKRLTQVYRDRDVNPTRAIELYREILELSPGDVQASRALTSLYERAGDHHQVSELLREQYERSRSPTEQATILKQLAELWHHDLEAPNEAIWACETILERSPADREALVRLQQLLEEQGRYTELIRALQRELDQAGNKEAKVKVLRRMARVAEHQLGDEDQAASIWSELLGLLPGNLEVLDKVVSLYDASARYEQLGTLLLKAAGSPQTPEIRQVDYLLRLAQLAEASLDDAELSRSCFEKVLRSRPDHRGALEALVRIYRAEHVWGPLCDVLGRLQGLAETDDDAFRIAWERAEILAEQLDEPLRAIEVLEALARTEAAAGNPDIGRTLLDLYDRAERHRDVIRQAELVLLATSDPGARRGLYDTIATTWLERLGDKPAALAAYARLVDEFSDDTEGLATMAGLQREVGDHEGALASLQRRLDLLREPLEKTATLVQMSELAETQIGDGARALDLLRRALAVDHYAEDVLVRARRVAKQHGLWRELLGLFDERFVHMSNAGDVGAQIEVCFEASEVAEVRYGDAEKAFDWARRGFFVAVENDRDGTQGETRLRRLADAHRLWNPLLGVLEEEIALQERRGAVARGHFDMAARLQQAADIAIERLDDPARAVAYLQRAYRHDPDDDALCERIERTARAHQLWSALIELHGGLLERAVTDGARLEACEAIAKIYEEELNDPEKAFEWLRQAWLELRGRDVRLAQQAIDRLLVLSERHSLWPQLANHHLLRAREAFEAGAATQGLADLREAAQVFDQRLEDPLGALRVLASGLPHDPGGDVLLPDIRTLGEKVDERRSGDVPALGALLHLAVLQRLASGSRSDDEMLQLLEERAEIRETRLVDPRGAMAEWLRVLHLRPDDDQALVELERLAEEGDAWDAFLVLPAWRLERATGDVHEEAALLRRLAQLYEGPLERSEYALRARLEAWRREPELPRAGEELDDQHSAIWRLAEQTGAYHTPPVPRDPLLRPAVELPELSDLRTWGAAGLDPEALLGQPPSPFAAKLDVSSPQAILRTITQEISLSVPTERPITVSVAAPEPDDAAKQTIPRRLPIGAGPPSPPPPRAPGVPMQVPAVRTTEIDDIEEIEDLELVEVEPVDEATVTMASTGMLPRPLATDDGLTRTNVLPKVPAPPPPPRTPGVGLPPVPRLAGNVLPPRPRVATAWDEVAAAYAGAPTRDKAAQVEVALVLARLWEEGAGNLERTFAAHEQALLVVPEHPGALEGLRALAERHNMLDRLLVAYQRLLAEATMPEHLLAQNMRIAALHESRDDLRAAEACYRAVLGVSPRHVPALESLLRIYAAEDRTADQAEVLTELIDAEFDRWPEDTLVERTLELTTMLRERLSRPDEALDRLMLLVRQCPHHRAVHQAHVDALVALRRWQPAIEAMRTASTAVGDPDLHYANLARTAEIYERELGLPDRALTTLQELVDAPDGVVPDELLDGVLARQQRLLETAGRHERLLATIERRLERAADDDARVPLLIDKARVLHEGLGDEDAAVATLEDLRRQAPDRDDVALALGRLYRKTERYEEGVALLRERLRALAPSSERALGLSLTLAEVMAEEGGDARGALQVIEAASEHHEGDVRLRDRSVALCRTLREPAALVEALQARGEPDDLLEAARLLHREVGDGARALELYSRVLAEAKLHSDQEAHARRLAAALEGLVKLRVEDGDIAGAMDFMDKQLAEVEGPTIRALLLAEMGRITYQSTGDVAAARERFDAALREDPQHAQAKLGLARILVLADALHEAEGHLTAAVDALALAGQQTELVEALVILAEVLERTDRSGEAYRRLTAALRHDPDNLEIRAAVVRNRHGAQRHRDAITAVEQIEQRLAEHPAAPEQRRLVSDTFVLAARSEEASKNPDGAYARYRRAAEIDPDNPAALEPLLPLCHEHGAWVEAAGHTLALARGTESRELRAQRFVDAALLYFDAAATVADTHDPDAPQTPESLRQSALLAMRSGLELAEGYEEPILERGALEAAFRHAAPRDAVAGLRILEQLLRHPEIPEPRQHDLLLEGARLALSAGERLELAERYAFKARQLVPGSSAAVLAHAEVLQAADRVEEIEPLVESFFVARRDEGDDAEERRHRITLLLRLAELQGSHPEKAVGSLERAAALAGDALPASERRRLAELYGQLGRRDDAAMDNHRRLLEQEPLFVPSLAALAAHHAEAGELDHAFALWSLVSLVEPAHPQAQAFLLDHRMVGEPPEGPVSDSWLEDLRPPPLSDAGVGEVLLQLWEGGASLLSEHLPKLEIPADARVSPLGEGLVCQAWAELLKRLGQGKVALVDTMGLPEEHEAERPDGSRDGGFFHVRCQNPPVILADGRAFHTDDPDEVRFALGRAIYFTRPEAVFAMGLRRVVLAQLLSATFGAFHPRHARRRHHARGEDDDFAGRLGQDLTRKLPVKVARRLATVLKTYEDEPFDTRTWRAWVRCCGNRVGLALCGQLPAALRVLNDGDIEPIGDELREWAAHDGDVRDLLAFAASPAYVRARRELGATVLLTVDDDE